MTRDVLIGIVAGAAALAVVRWRPAAPVAVPPGIYQASIDQRKHREVMQTLEPAAFTTGATRDRLATRLDRFEVEDARLEGVVAYLSEAAGVDVEVDWDGLRLDKGRTVTLKLDGPTVAQALRGVFEEAVPRAPDGEEMVRFAIEVGRVRVTSPHAPSGGERVVRVYDVRDVVLGMIDAEKNLRVRRVPPAELPFRRPRGLFASSGRERLDDFATSPQEALDSLVRLIQETADPTSWRDTGGSVGGIRALGYKLIVTQSPACHEDVAVLLAWAREATK